MKQPELGKKISEIRNQKEITQKVLSDSCGIDIRTIQRIESGNVTPRPSTLKIISEALDLETLFNFEKNIDFLYSFKALTLYILIGVLYLLSWIIYSPIIPINEVLSPFALHISLFFTLISVIFYYGFFDLGRKSLNKVLQISSLITIISIPISLISSLIDENLSVAKHFHQFTIVIMGLNSIAFGIGILRIRRNLNYLKNITGILQLVIAPFFIIPLPILNYVGCWLTIPFILLLISMIVQEYLETKKVNQTDKFKPSV